MFCPHCKKKLEINYETISCKNPICLKTEVQDPFYHPRGKEIKGYKYLQETELIVEMLHEFERSENGKDVQITVVCFNEFIPKLAKKIDQGRFSKYAYHYEGAEFIRMHDEELSNSYTISIKRLLTIQPLLDKSMIYLSVVIDQTIIDNLLCDRYE